VYTKEEESNIGIDFAVAAAAPDSRRRRLPGAGARGRPRFDRRFYARCARDVTAGPTQYLMRSSG